MHWIINDNRCALSIIEKNIKKKLYNTDELECFTCKIFEPIYDFKSNYEYFSYIIYTITVILWIITLFKLYKYNIYLNNI